MTTLYRSVLIETTEQAEALPPSTPVIIGPFVAMRPGTEKTWGMSYTDGDYSSAELVASFPAYDLTALVPIEADEERDDEWADLGGVNRRRLVTPWEES